MPIDSAVKLKLDKKVRQFNTQFKSAISKKQYVYYFFCTDADVSEAMIATGNEKKVKTATGQFLRVFKSGYPGNPLESEVVIKKVSGEIVLLIDQTRSTAKPMHIKKAFRKGELIGGNRYLNTNAKSWTLGVLGPNGESILMGPANDTDAESERQRVTREMKKKNKISLNKGLKI